MTDDDRIPGSAGSGRARPADRYDLAFEDSAIGMAIEGLDGRFTAVNRALCHLVGYSRERLLTMSYMDICHPDDLEGEEHLAGLVDGSRQAYIDELRYIRADRVVVWVRVHVGVIHDEGGAAACYAVQIEDVSQRHRAEQRFRSSFDDAAIGIALIEPAWGDDTIVEANAMTSGLLGRPVAQLIGASLSTFVHSEDVAEVQRLFSDLKSGERRQSEASVRFVARGGAVVWAQLSAAAPGRTGDHTALLVLHLQDITARRVAEEQLIHLAGHDALTGLPNRRALTQELAAMSTVASEGRIDHRALLFIDLDGFKLVNDSLGHTVGDELLVAVAGRLRRVMAADDLVARIGGDEFVVLARSTSTTGAAERLAERLRLVLGAPFGVGGRTLHLTASVGIALVEHGVDPDGLLPAADLALHRAKAAGKARAVVFDASMRRQAEGHLATEQGLYRALARDELVLCFQSIFSLVTGRPVAAEALLWWQHPETGLLRPADVVPVAEETGLIIPIGRHVLNRALDQVRSWRDRNIGLIVNVNLAGAQLDDPGLVTEIEAMLANRGLLPSDLCLEVTERAIVAPGSRVASTVTELRRLGVSVAIDDFGMGHSSLTHLRSYPVDVAKIDGSFFATLDSNPRDAAIVAGVIHLIHALGMSCIAEGVQTRTQLDHLAGLGCDQVQGDLIGRAQPAEAWLRSSLGPGADRLAHLRSGDPDPTL